MSTGNSTDAPMVRVLKMAGSAASFVALCFAALAALVLVVVPLLTGSQTYSVLTSSMAPKYAPGTFLVVKPTPVDTLQVGDVITFQIESGKPTVITHRIIGISAGQNGERSFTTQGDNNSVADEFPVQEVQIRGKLWYAVPYVGFVANSLGNSDRGEIVQWAAVGLLGYGVVAMVRGTLQAKRRRGETPASSSEFPETPGTPEVLDTPDSFSPVITVPTGHSPRHRAAHSDAGLVDAHDLVLFDCDDCEHGHHLATTAAAGQGVRV
ncbi:signal peptidase I [Arthrobacter sp. NPDC055585]